MNIKYLVIIMLLSISCSSLKQSFSNDDKPFSHGIKTKQDCLKKHGIPDFKYFDLSTNEAWAYKDSIKGGVYSLKFADNNYIGQNWMLNFKLPDTTETVYIEDSPVIPSNQTLINDQCLIKYIDGYGYNSLIKFNFKDSVGTITRNGEVLNINVTSINKTLIKYPVYHIGSIKKNYEGSFLHVGYIQLWVKENDSIHYSSMIALNWYDKRFESVLQEIWKLL